MVRAQVFFALLLLLPVSCTSLKQTPRPGEVEHVVLMWLKRPGDKDDRARLIEVSKSLKAIPDVISLSVGEVLASDRAVVDDSFDVGLVMRFASSEAGEAYQKHPLHVRAVKEELGPQVKKIVVYDFTTR